MLIILIEANDVVSFGVVINRLVFKRIYMVRIITDSSADLRPEEYIELGVSPLYLIINQGEREFRDGQDIFGRDLFRGLAEGRNYSSAQVPVFDYLKLFNSLASQGHDFIYLSISSGISGSFETASLAMEAIKEGYPEVRMAVVDSRGASVGQGLIVRKLAEAAKKEKSFEELMELAVFLQSHIKHGLIVPDLNHLSKGGRLSKSQVVLGNLMGIIPLIEFDSQGNLYVLDKIRGRKKAQRFFLNKALKDNPGLDEINIVYTDEESRDSFLKEVQELMPGVKVEDWELGCAIGLHTGPGALGIAYLDKNIPDKFI